ncbi:MAG: hypothetical protein HYX36_11355 [Rhizobiales bacterium]|nr:hypothetical protein [Hyphomicrobiales bacterium]
MFLSIAGFLSLLAILFVAHAYVTIWLGGYCLASVTLDEARGAAEKDYREALADQLVALPTKQTGGQQNVELCAVTSMDSVGFPYRVECRFFDPLTNYDDHGTYDISRCGTVALRSDL